MRTTLDIDEDILRAAGDLARQQQTTVGAVLSDLARQALRRLQGVPPEAVIGARRATAFLGFQPFPQRGGVVTDELVSQLRASSSD